MTNVFNHILYTPKNFSEQNLKFFLNDASRLFSIKKPLEGFYFNGCQTEKVSLVGLLLTYKFLEYSVINNKFIRPRCKFSSSFDAEMLKNSFYDLIYSFINNAPQRYDKFKFARDKDLFFLAPIVLDKTKKDSTVNLFADKISQYYNYDEIIFSVVLQILAETASNFMGHAENDMRSILVAKGDRSKFQLCCADTGIGIISNLNKIFRNNIPKLLPHQILLKSLERGVTSDPSPVSGHMGSGLWIINNYVTAAKGELYLYSENTYLINKKGKITAGKSPYWKGTVISLTLPLVKPSVFLEEIDNMEKTLTLL